MWLILQWGALSSHFCLPQPAPSLEVTAHSRERPSQPVSLGLWEAWECSTKPTWGTSSPSAPILLPRRVCSWPSYSAGTLRLHHHSNTHILQAGTAGSIKVSSPQLWNPTEPSRGITAQKRFFVQCTGLPALASHTQSLLSVVRVLLWSGANSLLHHLQQIILW